MASYTEHSTEYLTFGTLFKTRRILVSEGQSQFTEFLRTLIVRRFGYEDEPRIADAACLFLGTSPPEQTAADPRPFDGRRVDNIFPAPLPPARLR
jgi:hypothetical protein